MAKSRPSNVLIRVVIGITLLFVSFAVGALLLQVKNQPPSTQEDLETEQLP